MPQLVQKLGLLIKALTNMLNALSKHHFMEDFSSTHPNEPVISISLVKSGGTSATYDSSISGCLAFWRGCGSFCGGVVLNVEAGGSLTCLQNQTVSVGQPGCDWGGLTTKQPRLWLVFWLYPEFFSVLISLLLR
jgi:hypothetical protein